jgi:hypothetical protein
VTEANEWIEKRSVAVDQYYSDQIHTVRVKSIEKIICWFCWWPRQRLYRWNSMDILYNYFYTVET